jgi:hypothetical protein
MLKDELISGSNHGSIEKLKAEKDKNLLMKKLRNGSR